MEWLNIAEPRQLLLTAAVALGVMWVIKRLVSQPKNLPPGPRGLPLLGVIWPLVGAKSDPLSLFASWAERYGDIISFNVGPLRFVVLNSYDVIVEAFRHPDLHDRPQSQMIKEVIGVGNNGIALANGKVWKEQRNFAHTVFRNLGVGKRSYEESIAAEMSQLMAALEEKEGNPFNPMSLFGQAIANITCRVVFGTQYKYTDADFKRILRNINTNIKLAGGGGVLIFLPIPGISKIPFGSPKIMVENMKDTHDFLVKQVKEHEKNLDPDNPRDFIDLYLNKIAETKGEDTSFNKLNLDTSMADIFVAGSETTSTTLNWCVLHMMAYPDVQSRVHAELDQVVGRDRLPCLDDRKNLPYTDAVLMEIQRKGVIAPLGVPHIAAADTTIRGYTIPKGATVFPNIWQVMNNEELWRDAGSFNPERFLTADGQLIKREELIFFGTGRRVCLGEQLARMETFLAFTSLLHRFTFTKPPGSPPVSLEAVMGLTRNTKPFETCAVVRA